MYILYAFSLVPYEWYEHPQKVFSTLFPYFFVKTHEIVCKYFRNKNIFKRHKCPLVNKSSNNYFLIFSLHHERILGIIKPSTH